MADVLASAGAGKVQSDVDKPTQELADAAVLLALRKGFMLRSASSAVEGMHAPFALLPRKLPAPVFSMLKEIQPAYNQLVDAVARDFTWLKQTLAGAAAADPFTAALMDLAEQVHAEGWHQPLALGLHRSDYMLETAGSGEEAGEGTRALQIELNTIAAGFGTLSGCVSGLHARMVSRYGFDHPTVAAALLGEGGLAAAAGVTLPPNAPAKSMAQALAAAHSAYGGSKTAVLFVTQPGERNVFDQLGLEDALWENHGVRTVWGSLTSLASEAVLVTPDGPVFADGTPAPAPHVAAMPDWSLWVPAHLTTPETAAGDARAKGAGVSLVQVSTVYLRAGYTPDDYPSAGEWQARSLLERSAAIKAPNVFYQLVGAKKVQQELALAGGLEHFTGEGQGQLSPDQATALRSTFAGLWSLDAKDAAATATVVQDALQNPQDYVMKPQREGGGNNLYGQALAKALSGMSPEERGAFILMQRIKPEASPAVVVKAGQAILLPETICEVGIYGAFLGDSSTVMLNCEAGHLVRTKAVSSDEGGVAKGFAVLDSPALV